MNPLNIIKKVGTVAIATTLFFLTSASANDKHLVEEARKIWSEAQQAQTQNEEDREEARALQTLQPLLKKTPSSQEELDARTLALQIREDDRSDLLKEGKPLEAHLAEEADLLEDMVEDAQSVYTSLKGKGSSSKLLSEVQLAHVMTLHAYAYASESLDEEHNRIEKAKDQARVYASKGDAAAVKDYYSALAELWRALQDPEKAPASQRRSILNAKKSLPGHLFGKMVYLLSEGMHANAEVIPDEVNEPFKKAFEKVITYTHSKAFRNHLRLIRAKQVKKTIDAYLKGEQHRNLSSSILSLASYEPLRSAAAQAAHAVTTGKKEAVEGFLPDLEAAIETLEKTSREPTITLQVNTPLYALAVRTLRGERRTSLRFEEVDFSEHPPVSVAVKEPISTISNLLFSIGQPQNYPPLQGGVTYTNDIDGKGMFFNGKSFLTYKNNRYDITGGLAILAGIKTTNKKSMAILDRRAGFFDGFGLWLKEGKPLFYLGNGKATHDVLGKQDLSDGKYHIIYASWRGPGSSPRISVDFKQEVMGNTKKDSINPSADTLALGYDLANKGLHFKGTIYSIHLFKGTPNSRQIKSLVRKMQSQ